MTQEAIKGASLFLLGLLVLLVPTVIYWVVALYLMGRGFETIVNSRPRWRQ